MATKRKNSNSHSRKVKKSISNSRSKTRNLVQYVALCCAGVAIIPSCIQMYADYVNIHAAAFNWTILYAFAFWPLLLIAITSSMVALVIASKKNQLSKTIQMMSTALLAVSLLCALAIVPAYANYAELQSTKLTPAEIKSDNQADRDAAASLKIAQNYSYSTTHFHAYLPTFVPPGLIAQRIYYDQNDQDIYQWVKRTPPTKAFDETPDVYNVRSFANQQYLNFQGQTLVNTGVTTSWGSSIYISQAGEGTNKEVTYVTQINGMPVELTTSNYQYGGFAPDSIFIVNQYYLQILNSLTAVN